MWQSAIREGHFEDGNALYFLYKVDGNWAWMRREVGKRAAPAPQPVY